MAVGAFTPDDLIGFDLAPIHVSCEVLNSDLKPYNDRKNEAALDRDIAKLDTTLAVLRGQSNDWEIPPRFMRSGNMAAVILTRNEQQAERLTLAITAGAPQPGS